MLHYRNGDGDLKDRIYNIAVSRKQEGSSLREKQKKVNYFDRDRQVQVTWKEPNNETFTGTEVPQLGDKENNNVWLGSKEQISVS